MDSQDDMQDEPLDLSKKVSTDSVVEVEPVLPARFAYPQCGLTEPMKVTERPTEQEMVKYTHSHETSKETEEYMEEATAKDDKQNTVRDNYDAMGRRVNTCDNLPNPSFPYQYKSGSQEESVLLFERSGVRRKNERSIATQTFSTHFKKQEKDRPFKCEECDMAFELKKNFEAHAKTHSGYKPYKCQECNKAFNKESYLNKHKIIHTGIKPYKCNECNKAFSRKHYLGLHERIHKGNLPYQCNVCGRQFNQLWLLKRHNDIHTGNKLHICNVCQRAFAQKTHMESHLKVHTADKPFKCNVCNKGFSQKQNLKKHEHTHKKR